ncbi:glycosyltransferase [Paenibacillus sp. GCM10027627]|uniref:glycosyltransferase n=1 Tax=unclassified Paenibacillus TaxID=185978 RepID=UPI003638F046
MKIPNVNICIVTYNSEEDITSCLDAVLEQSYPVGKIIVIDNASSDGTLNRLSPYLNRIHLVCNQINNGFAGGQNQAIRLFPSDYYLVLNPDVFLHSDYISEVIKFMESHREVGSATGKLVLESDNKIMDSAGIELKWYRKANDLAAGQLAADWNSITPVFGVSGAAAVYRAEMINQISLDNHFFDEDYFAYKEDVDVAWRAQNLGWRSYFIPTALARHKRGWKAGDRRRISLFLRKRSYQNHIYTLIKNEAVGWRLVYMLPILVFLEVAKLVYLLLREPGLLRVWPDIIKLAPQMVDKRRKIYGSVSVNIKAK